MLQKDNLLEWRTIWKNVIFGLEVRRQLDGEATARARRLLQSYGLWAGGAAGEDHHPVPHADALRDVVGHHDGGDALPAQDAVDVVGGGKADTGRGGDHRQLHPQPAQPHLAHLDHHVRGGGTLDPSPAP